MSVCPKAPSTVIEVEKSRACLINKKDSICRWYLAPSRVIVKKRFNMSHERF